MDIDISTILADVRMKSPIVITGGVMSDELLFKALDLGVGAITIGTIALKPKSRHPPPFIVRLPYGFVNAYGIRRGLDDVKDFIVKILDVAERNDVKIICSCIEESLDSLKLIVRELEDLGCHIIELNASAPILKEVLELGLRADVLAKVVAQVSSTSRKPLSVKLSPLIVDVTSVAKELARAGMRIAHLINALSPALVIDVNTGKPILGIKGGIGALSGPAIKPIALAKVMMVAKNNPGLPIIGTGGVTSWRDAIEMIMVGASAVGLHSVLYIKGVRVIKEILSGIREFMKVRGYRSLEEFRGLTLKYV